MENDMNTTEVNTNEPKAKLIFNASLMKYLIEEKGMADQIIGLKANRENKDRCIFVCLDSLRLRDSMQEYSKISRQRRAERARAKAEEEKESYIEQED